MDEAEGQLAQMSEEWDAVLANSAVDQAVLADWEQSIDSMRRETASLRDRDRWRGGYRTLMHAPRIAGYKSRSEKNPRCGSVNVPMIRPRSRNRLNSSQLVSGRRAHPWQAAR